MPYREQGKMRSVDPTRFSMVPRNDVPRSAFDYRAGHKTTFQGGALVPFYVEEVLPGDSFRVRMAAFARLAAAIVPIMDNLYFESFFFYVPNRLVWEHWEQFMGYLESPGDASVTYLTPQVDVDVALTEPGTIADYMGVTLNATVGADINVLAFPFRAYSLIYNEWFRDQDLIGPLDQHVDDGPDPITDYAVMQRGKRHDYFTSARPWPQKPQRNEIVSGIGGSANLVPGGNFTIQNPFTIGAPVTGIGTQDTSPSAGPVTVTNAGNRVFNYDTYHETSTSPFFMDASATGVPQIRVLVNDIRTSLMIQSLMEKNARGGTRYSELIQSHFGVTPQDARLQRPEYLGGGRSNITVNPVAQSVDEADGGRKLGELGGVASTIHHASWSHSFTEHGFIIGLVSVRADLSYQQGIERFWFRRTSFDFYWPSLAHLGEQAIFRKEIYAIGDPTFDDVVFGYQERWSEYKWRPNRISGLLRSNIQGVEPSLDVWHLSQDFSAAPVLNEIFVSEAPPLARVLTNQEFGPSQIVMDSVLDIRAVRAMPMFSVPGLGPRL